MKKMTMRLAIASLMMLLLGAGTAVANAADLRATMDEAGIGIEANAGYRAITLRITGEGQVVERSFGADDLAYVAHAEFNLPDGQYRYEAVMTPDVDELVRRGRRSEGPSASRNEDNRVAGAFRISSGAIVLDRGETEPGAPAPAPDPRTPNADGLVSSFEAAQTIATDLIVVGSECVGVDCTSSESFGFDTIRLKENNLRIRFFDTSNSGSFPSNDWQLVANETANGGLNKFSIEDIDGAKTPFTIEAGAANNSLYVDDAGNLGLNTNAPVVEVHVRDGDSPTLRLEQDGSSGFQAQTWDIAGNETNFFVRDVNNGSKLPFKIFPNAPTNSLTVKGGSGDIGVGTANPSERVHVQSSGVGNILLRGAGAQSVVLEDTSVTDAKWFLGNSGDDTFKISADGTGGVEARFARNGDLTIRGDLIKAGSGAYAFPDYVFDEGYSLRSLDQLREFISANGHLPGVMSEKEVSDSGGVPVHRLQLQTLEKVEEMALYILQLEERLSRLEASPSAQEDSE